MGNPLARRVARFPSPIPLDNFSGGEFYPHSGVDAGGAGRAREGVHAGATTMRLGRARGRGAARRARCAPHQGGATMGKGRIEAFSDGVLAIIITIMVLEMKVPHGESLAVLAQLWPV